MIGRGGASFEIWRGRGREGEGGGRREGGERFATLEAAFDGGRDGLGDEAEGVDVYAFE